MDEAWDAVLPGLTAAGHRPLPVSLPAQTAETSLDDQLDAVLRVVDGAEAPVVVVGHSAACTLAWLAADRRPDAVAQVGLIGGIPTSDGEPYAAFFDVVDGFMPFPGWGPFEGADSADVSDEVKQDLAARAVPVPQGVSTAVVHYANPERTRTPVVLICPEFSPVDAKGWIDSGEVPELASAEHLSFVDIDTGHWPMFSAPDELARVIAEAADDLGAGSASRSAQ